MSLSLSLKSLSASIRQREQLVDTYVEKEHKRYGPLYPFDDLVFREREWIESNDSLKSFSHSHVTGGAKIDESLKGTESDPLCTDADVFLKHCNDKSALKLLQQSTQTIAHTQDDSVLREINAIVGMHWLPPVTEKRFNYDFNPTNETVRERTQRIVHSISLELLSDVLAETLHDVAVACQHWNRQAMQMMSRGLLKGVTQVNDSNYRFLHTSGKWKVLQGLLDDLCLQRTTMAPISNHDNKGQERLLQELKRLHVFRTQDIVDELSLKVIREDIRSMTDKVGHALSLIDQPKKSAMVIYQQNKREQEESQRRRQVRLDSVQTSAHTNHETISWLHSQGCLDLPTIEVNKRLEKNHVQAIRSLRLSMVDSVHGMTAGVTLDSKPFGVITACTTFADRESLSSLIVMGTSKGRLLCYRVDWTNRRPIELVGVNRAVDKKSKDKSQGQYTAIRSIRWNALAGPFHIVTLHENHHVYVWSLQEVLMPIVADEANANESQAVIVRNGLFDCFHWRPAKRRSSKEDPFIERIGHFQEEQLQYRFELDTRTLRVFGDEQSQDIKHRKKARQSNRTKYSQRQNKSLLYKAFGGMATGFAPVDDRFPTCVDLFAAVNERGQPTSVLMGGSDGEIFKMNLDRYWPSFRSNNIRPVVPFVTHEFVEPSTAPAGFIYTATGSSTSSRTNGTGAMAAVRNTRAHNIVQRELFHGHRKAAVCSMFCSDSATSAFVSFDEEMLFCKWNYDKQHLSGSGWFEPTVKAKLADAMAQWERDNNSADSATSLNELLESETQQQLIHQQLQVARIGYKEVAVRSPTKRTSSLAHPHRQHRWPARALHSPSSSTTAMSISSSPRNSIAQISPRTQVSPIPKRSPRAPRGVDRVERVFEFVKVYHPLRDEEEDEWLELEETITATLTQQAQDLNTPIEELESSKLMLDGVRYYVKSVSSHWTRYCVLNVMRQISLVTHTVAEDGSEVIFIYKVQNEVSNSRLPSPAKKTSRPSEESVAGKQVTENNTDNQEVENDGHSREPLIDVSKDPNGVDLNVDGRVDGDKPPNVNDHSPTAANYVIASLNTSTMELRQPLVFFSIEDTNTNILDVACGAVVAETNCRIVFVLTNHGIRQFSLSTGQELYFGASALHSQHRLVNDKQLISNLRTSCKDLSLRHDRITVCSSQRMLILWSSVHPTHQCEVILLTHDLDGTPSVSATVKSSPVDSSSSLLQLPEPFSALYNLLLKQDAPPLQQVLGNQIKNQATTETIISRFVEDSHTEGSDVALSILETILELLEDVVDIKALQQQKQSRIRAVLGDHLGHVPPTTWPPPQMTKLDILAARRIEEEDEEFEELERQQDELELMRLEDKDDDSI